MAATSSSASFPVGGITKGDVLDFAVDCREGPMADSFSWAPVVTTAARA